MTPAYFDESPPREKKRPSRIANESAKHREKRLANPPKLRKPIRRSLPPGAPKTAVKIRSVNVNAAKRRKASYAKKLAAYKRSETYKIVEQRSAGRCERMHLTGRLGSGLQFTRCHESRENGHTMTHNHKRYGRQFGGNERPEDMELLGPRCNAIYEASKRPWNKGRGFGGKVNV